MKLFEGYGNKLHDSHLNIKHLYKNKIDLQKNFMLLVLGYVYVNTDRTKNINLKQVFFELNIYDFLKFKIKIQADLSPNY